MQAGRLRHAVTLQALEVELDSDGGEQTETWADAFPAPLRCEISPLSGRELIAAQAVQSKVTTRIMLRYRPGIVASMRAVHRDTVYHIDAIVPDRHTGTQWLTLLCTSGINEG